MRLRFHCCATLPFRVAAAGSFTLALFWCTFASDGAEDAGEPVPGVASRVVDAAGQPIAGARVEIHPYRRKREKPLATVVTDSKGQFLYPDATPGEGHFYVDVHAKGFLSRHWIGNRTVYRRRNGIRQSDTLTLSRPVRVSGRIVKSDGQPFAGAEISVDYFSEGGPACINCIRVKSDAKGRFHAEEIPPGNLFVRYEEQGNRRPTGVQTAKMSIAVIKAKDGQVVRDVLLDLAQSKCVLQGAVVDENGEGIEGRWISATLASAKGRLDESVTVVTDKEGRFRFEGLQAAEFVVGTYMPGHSVTAKLNAKKPTEVELHTYIAGREPPKDRRTKLFWGEPDAAGLSAAILIKPAKAAFRFGESVNVSVLVRNTGTKKKLFTHSSSQHTELQVLDEQGKIIQRINYAAFTGIPVHSKYVLGPGQEANVSGFRIELLDETQKQSDTPRGGATFAIRSRRGKPVRLQADLSMDVFSNKPKDGKLSGPPLKTGVMSVFVTERPKRGK